MKETRFIRSAGVCATIGGTIAAVGAAISAGIEPAVPVTRLSHPYSASTFVVTEVIWTLTHVLMLIGTVGLARSGAVGTSGAGRAGMRIALVGMTLIVPSELGFAFFPNADDDAAPVVALGSAIGLGTVIAGIGFTLAGVSVMRERRWSGWRRLTPLPCGLSVFLVLLPTLAAGRETDWFFLGVGGWSACFIPLGLALYHAGRGVAPRSPEAGIAA